MTLRELARELMSDPEIGEDAVWTDGGSNWTLDNYVAECDSNPDPDTDESEADLQAHRVYHTDGTICIHLVESDGALAGSPILTQVRS